jgi:ABC-type nitrate/sulfonate/bicarbonate transport system substrate-binding protein
MKLRNDFARQLMGAAVAGVALTFAVGAHAQELDKLHLLTPNVAATSTYAAFVAEELGFYKDQGLEVTYDNGGDTTVPFVAFLMNKQVDLTMLDSTQVLQAVNAGQPVSVIYEVMQYAPDRVSVAADSPIQSLAEL